MNIYPPEFIFAEKLKTLFRLGTGNTSCKDLIDLWSLIKLGMDDVKLQKAVKAYFENRSQVFSQVRLEENLQNEFIAKPNIIELVPIDSEEWSELMGKAYKKHRYNMK